MAYKLTLNYFLYLLYFLLPFSLITGPAIPDIFLTLFVLLIIFFKINIIFEIKEKWMLNYILLWLWFILVSFFAYNFDKSITDGVIYIRFILFII